MKSEQKLEFEQEAICKRMFFSPGLYNWTGREKRDKVKNFAYVNEGKKVRVTTTIEILED